LYEKRIEMFNVHVEATAARHGLALIDLFSLTREIGGEMFSADGFHPSGEGYEAWAEQMETVIEPLLRSEARP
jgi:lysophospholipase L1-like esterase